MQPQRGEAQQGAFVELLEGADRRREPAELLEHGVARGALRAGGVAFGPLLPQELLDHRRHDSREVRRGLQLFVFVVVAVELELAFELTEEAVEVAARLAAAIELGESFRARPSVRCDGSAPGSAPRRRSAARTKRR